jgi:hypothetical protein
MLPNEVVPMYTLGLPWDWFAWPARFGNNVIYNLVMCALFLLGPIGMPLIITGARAKGELRVLFYSVIVSFGLAMLHDDRGLHALGPIHYSEASVLMLLLAAEGLFAAFAWFSKVELSLPAAGALAGYATFGLTIFAGGYCSAWRETNTLQRDIYDLVDQPGSSPRVVLAPPYSAIFTNIDRHGSGTWVFSWRRVRPEANEFSILLHDSMKSRALAQTFFPDREVLVLELNPRTGWTLTPVSQAQPLRDSPYAWVPVRGGPN